MNRCPFALWTPSPNFTVGRPAPWDLIVIHITDGQPDVERAVESHLKAANRKAAHFFAGRAGERYQLVDLDDTAWHAAGVNKRSVGLEHPARAPGEFDRDGWAGWSPSYRAKFLDPGDEVGIYASSDPGLFPTDAQYDASARLVAWLCSVRGRAPSREWIKGHCEATDTTHRDCPNAVWDWSRYMGLVDEAYVKLRAT